MDSTLGLLMCLCVLLYMAIRVYGQPRRKPRRWRHLANSIHP